MIEDDPFPEMPDIATDIEPERASPREWSEKGWVSRFTGMDFNAWTYRGQPLDVFQVLELIARVGILVVLIRWFSEIPDRAQERHSRDWILISLGKGDSSADLGRRAALKDLAKDHQPLIGLPLYGITLTNLDLSDQNLSRSVFRKGILSDVLFSQAVLDNVSFFEARLNNINFDKTSLSNMEFSYASLDNCTFRESHISDVQNFNNADIRNSDFSRSILKNINFDGSVFGQGVVFKRAHLAHVSFRRVSVTSASGARLLEESDLVGARLCNVILGDGREIGGDCYP